jgi:uncharacterized protein YlzI (FlbEa/FlbD family)
LKFRFEIVILVFIAITIAILQWPYIFEFPGHIHGWAQADRLALANGFIRNGLDLFHPETQVFNHIYPHDFGVQASSTITAVDCPLHDFIAALLIKLSGCQSHMVFRFYVLFMSALGLVFLGKLSLLILKDEMKAIFVVVFAALSPVFVYYQGTLLPSVPSLSLSIIGLFYYFRFRHGNREGDFHIAIICLGIALMTRATFLIPFVALLAIEFLSCLKNRDWPIRRIISSVLVLSVFFVYRIHNQILTEEYGSMFLNHLMPPDSWEQIGVLLNYIWTHWRFTYFSSIHYWTVLILALVLIGYRLAKNTSERASQWLTYFVAIYFFGCCLFTGVMLKQFQDHDYYFLDTFYMPFVLGLIVLLSFAPTVSTRNLRLLYGFVIIVFIGASFRMPQRSQQNRYKWREDDRLQKSINDYRDSDLLLNELGISQDAIMLVMDAMSPNTALTLMNRKGLVVMNSEQKVIENALRWNFDYVVFQNENLDGQNYKFYPELMNKLSPVGSNGSISVYRVLE